MENKERIILLTGGILKFLDSASSIAYISTCTFYSDLYFYLIVFTFIIPTIILLLSYPISLCIQRIILHDPSQFCNYYLLPEQFGISSISYSIFFHKRKLHENEPTIIFMTKLIAMVNTFCESMPQLFLQVYNSGLLKTSGIILIISAVTSGVSIIFSFARVIYTHEVKNKIQSTMEMVGHTATINKSLNDITAEEI